MDIYEKLQEIGLTGNEAKAYLELLKKGELSANQIARNLGMDRTLSYTVLNHLIEKGHVSFVIRENKKFFSCANLESLLGSIKAKELLVRELIGELGKIDRREQQETEIKVYEGKEGFRTVIRFMMKYKLILSFGSTGRAIDILYEIPALAKEWAKKKARARIITTTKYKEHEMTRMNFIESRYLDVKAESTTSIFGDYVAIQLSVNKPIVILIRDKYIAESYRNHFEVLWKAAKKL